MLVEIVLAGAATVGMPARFRRDEVNTCAPSCELSQVDYPRPVSAPAATFEEIAEPVDVLEAGDLWDTPLTNEQAIAYGKALMKDGTSDFVEID